MRILVTILISTLLVGCGIDGFIQKQMYKVGDCYANDRWSHAFIIEEVLDYGVVIKEVKRSPVVYLGCPQRTEKAYLTFRLFRDMYFEKIDCILLRDLDKESE